MKNESMRTTEATLPATLWRADGAKIGLGSALAAHQRPSAGAPTNRTDTEDKAASRFAAWIHAPFIP